MGGKIFDCNKCCRTMHILFLDCILIYFLIICLVFNLHVLFALLYLAIKIYLVELHTYFCFAVSETEIFHLVPPSVSI